MRYNNSMTEVFKRPDPDQILARLKEEEQKQALGKLKIFLGYVAGVGKTYAMLEAAHQRKEEGVDVVIGYLETHGRKETEALATGLEWIDCKQVSYRGTTLNEMDLDAILARRPRLVLVDELAHTNAPESRHPKRYLDVEELLGAGIDVYTTVNIQHLESLNDVVQQITGVTIRETVPDRIVDEAYEIELIDLPTDELLQRLKEGKVYVPNQAARALEQFFRKGNLTALRELSMRRAARRVDSQMLSYMQTKSISGPWPAGNRILVCISSHPMGERLVRAGRRLADDLNADWTVMFVETPGHMHMPDVNRARVQKYLELAETLGAKVVSVTDESVAEVVINYAHEHNITKIIAGKPLRPRWSEILRGGSVIDQIIRRSGQIDVYVVSEETVIPQKASPHFWKDWIPHRPLGRYILSLGLVLLMTLAGLPLRGFLDPPNLVMLYLVAEIISAVFLGRGPSILASFISVFAFDFFFVEPQLTFAVTDTQYIITFIGLFTVGMIISNSAALLRDQVILLRRREQQTQALNVLGRELTGAITLDQVLDTVIRNVGEMFNREAVILLPEGKSENQHVVAMASTPGFEMSEAELAVADWAYKHGQPAGRGTDTLSAAAIRYIPLVTIRGIVGVLGNKPLDPENRLSVDQRILMEGVANFSALAIERALFADKAAQNETLKNTEKLQTALLNSISHELRTPLAAITGVLTSLSESAQADTDQQLDPATSQELIDSATQQAQRLNHLVENLLDMTRLEAGALRLNCEPGDFQDLIGTVLRQSAHRFAQHPIQVKISPDLPLIAMDAVLIGQVLTNLLDNACKYSALNSPIEVSVRLLKKQVEVVVKDQGIGIPEEDIERVFDKFYRVQRQEPIAGTGLGLSICKGIIEAHGGTIWAKNNPRAGTTISFTLPLGS
jgi:two-component system, OmpR family, sensor histidine kinase KdpD